jgi:serine/threonine protein kinase
MSDKEKLQLVSEVNIMRELYHPNIVRYYERIVDKENCIISIIMEYCEGGDLSSMIKKHKREKFKLVFMRRKCIDECLIWKLFSQILLGLHECHNFKHGVVLHRDLKPENTFLDGLMNAKIGDFGLSRVLEREADFAKTFVGTPYYMSPEQVTEATYDIKSDIWSLGCLVYEICSLSPPFDASSQQQLSAKIMQGYYYRIPSVYSEDLVRVIKSMLQTDVFHPN